VLVRLATRTLEWDLAAAGNVEVMLKALTQVKPVVGPRLTEDLANADATTAASAILSKVADVKGRFAQELAELLSDPAQDFTAPGYLREAIEWVADPVAAEE
jgi:hypothetical protein